MRQILGALLVIGSILGAQAQVILKENFEPRSGYNAGDVPPGWTQSYVKGMKDWHFQKGGHNFNPDTAAQGNYNAAFYVESLENEKTKLITPAFSLKNISKPRLRFQHVQQVWPYGGVPYVDELRIYYRTSLTGAWQQVTGGIYTSAVNQWTQEELLLDPSTSTTYYLAFEGKTGYGHGACIDDVVIDEAGSLPRTVSGIDVYQAAINPIASGSTNNPIIRIDMQVSGTTSTLALQNLVVRSLNTSDADVVAGGVKLFATTNDIFSDQTKLATASFSSGVATFSGMSYDLPFGTRYLWVTYDIASSVAQGHTFDAFIGVNDITVQSLKYPATVLSPDGNRVIVETLFSDSFETDKGWTLGGGFQIATPTGLGGSEGGLPDPAAAANGIKVLGTGFSTTKTTDCDYISNLKDRQWYAISPKISCKYFKNTVLRFDRWLNLELWDNAYIDIKVKGDTAWTQIWASDQRYFIDSRWSNQEIDISAYADKKDSIQIRFSLGATSPAYNYSGWNIDNFALTGKFIANDVSVSQYISPVSGCGHTSKDTVVVRVINMAGKATATKIPLSYSFDGGVSFIFDTIYGSLGIGKDTLFKFHKLADLSQPGTVIPIVKTTLPNDDEPLNDAITASAIQIIPTYTFPYIADYETSSAYWFVTGSENSTWEWGKPSSAKIKTAGSGLRAWKTNLTGIYNYLDSSFVVSPCFDVRGNDFPVVDLLVNSDMRDTVAGATIQYTIDNGKTWSTVPQIDSLSVLWKWYNTKTNKPLLAKMGSGLGWSDTVPGWQQVRHFLPQTVRNKSRVQFRIAFASKMGIRTDGFAFDKLRFYDAPLDIGVTNLLAPLSACELSGSEKVVISVKNYGLDTLKTGTVLKFGYTLGKQAVTESYTLSANLLPKASFNYTFLQTLDLSHAGNYALKVFSCTPADINFFGKQNDSLAQTVRVYGMPDYDLGATFGSQLLDSVALDAQAGYTSYLWDNGFSKQVRNIKNAGTYKVTVTNSEGCVAKDSIHVFYSAKDLSVTAVSGLTSACQFSATVAPVIQIQNMHLETFLAGSKIVVAYQIDKQLPKYDTITLVSDFAKNEVLSYTFTKKIDFSVVGAYNCKFYTVLSDDIKHSNDTAKQLVENFGFPTVDLGADTVYVKNPKGIVLSVPSGFKTYKWQDGSTATSFTISDAGSKRYVVTVTDVNNCGIAKDSVQYITYDFAADSLISPHTACSFSKSETVKFRLKNNGTDVFAKNTPVKIKYSLNNATAIEENWTLPTALKPDSTVLVSFATPADFSKIQSHTIVVTASLALDKYSENDVLDEDFKVYGYPVVNLGADTLRTSQYDTVVFVATSPNAAYVWNVDTSWHEDKWQVVSPLSKWYVVTVTANSCATKDSSLLWTKDFTISTINLDASYCELPSNKAISVDVENICKDIIKAGEILKIGLVVDGSAPQIETITLPADLFPYGTYTHTFTSVYDLSSIGTHSVKAYIVKANDVNRKNDTTLLQTIVSGYPKPDLRADSLELINPLSTQLQVTKDFNKYWWKDAKKSNLYKTGSYIYQLPDDRPGLYYVKVEAGVGCMGSDSVRVITRNVRLSQILSPLSTCEGKSSDSVCITLRNDYSPLYAGDTIIFHHKLDAGATVNETFVLSKTIQSNEEFNYTFKANISTIVKKAYSLAIWFDYKKDVYSADNDSIMSFANFDKPLVDLGIDTIRTLNPASIVLKPTSASTLISYYWSGGTTDSNTPTTGLADSVTRKIYVTVTDLNYCNVVDSVYIVTADLKVSAMPKPISACNFTGNDSVQVKIENTGVDIIRSTQTLTARYSVSGGGVVAESFQLANDLLPGQSINHTFLQTVDLRAVTSATINASVSLQNEIDKLNNVVSKNVVRFDAPVIAFKFDTLFTTSPDTVLLDAGAGFSSYKWSTSASSQTQQLDANSSGWFAVTVSNADACVSVDSVCVVNRDLAITALLSPKSDCELTTTESVSVMIKNSGQLKYLKDSKIVVALLLNGVQISTDTTTLAADLVPNEQLQLNLKTTLNLASKQNQQLQVMLLVTRDASAANNSVSAVLNAWGYPAIGFAKDTILTSKPDTLRLSPGLGFATYKWSDNSSNDTLIPSAQSKRWFVTVSDVHACSSVDSIFIQNRDIAVSEIVSPKDNCKLTNNEQVEIKITNTGADVMPAGTKIPISVSVNKNIQFTDTLVLLTALSQDQASNIVSKSLDLSGFTSAEIGVEFSVQTKNAALWVNRDAVLSNNVVAKTISAWGYPTIGFKTDTILNSMPDTLQLSPGLGYDTYLWNDGSTNDTLIPTKTSQFWLVTVGNAHACTVKDSIYIQNRDIALESIVSPQNSCILGANEIVELQILNAGFDVIPVGAKIPVTVSVNNSTVYVDTLNISTALASGKSVVLQSKPLDLSAYKTALVSASISWTPDAQLANNIQTKTVDAFGKPVVGFAFDTILTTQPDTLILHANAGFSTYSWTPNLSATKDLKVSLQSGWYKVSVADGKQCSASDSVFVRTFDIAIDTIKPASTCLLSNKESIRAVFSNRGGDDLLAGTKVPVQYSVNGVEYLDTIKLSAKLAAKQNLMFVSKQTFDMSKKASFAVKMKIVWVGEQVSKQNDTTSAVINIWGYPTTSIAHHRIATSQPDTLKIALPNGYASYKWSNGSTNDTLFVSSHLSTSYFVTVDEGHGCSTVDSVMVISSELALDDLVSPKSKCVLTDKEPLKIQIRNNGADTLVSGTKLTIVWNMNVAAKQTEVLTLTKDLLPNDSIVWTSASVLNMADTGAYKLTGVIYRTIGKQSVQTDSQMVVVHHYGLPSLVLAKGVDTMRTALPYKLVAASGFASYNWNIKESNDTLNVTRSGKYSVTATTQYGCSANDAVVVWAHDIALTQFAFPQAQMCIEKMQDKLDVVAKNNGRDTFLVGTTIKYKYSLGWVDYNNQDTMSLSYDVVYSYTLTKNWLPDSTIHLQVPNITEWNKARDYVVKMTVYWGSDIDKKNNFIRLFFSVRKNLVMQLYNGDAKVTLKQDQKLIAPAGFVKYTWSTGSTDVETAVTTNGSYTLTVSDANGCSASDAIDVVIEVSSALDDELVNAIKVYPVPAQSSVVVAASENKVLAYQLFDATGKLLLHELFIESHERVQLHIDQLPAGTYWLNLQTEHGAVTRIIEKQ